MTPPYPPKTVITTGTVGRAVILSRRNSNVWRKIERGNAPSGIFTDNASPVEISIFILNFEPDDTLINIADGIAANREGKRQFYGWAQLEVEDASNDSRTVRATPQDSNPWHADIVLPCTATDRQERKKHAYNLAQMAKARPRVNNGTWANSVV